MRPEEFFLQAWKGQLDLALRLVEAMTAGAVQLRESQLEAAAASHADAEATRQAIAAAGDLNRIVELQAQWARANAQKCAAYWQTMTAAFTETEAEVANCLCSELPAALAIAAQPARLPAPAEA